jgi:hypothetical protein
MGWIIDPGWREGFRFLSAIVARASNRLNQKVQVA